MTTKTLLTIEYHTDTETGDVRVGEIDYGIKCDDLEKYLSRYGEAGEAEIIKTLEFLKSRITHYRPKT